LEVLSFEFPKGNGTHGIYLANFMVSAKKVQLPTTFDAHPIVPLGTKTTSLAQRVIKKKK